MAGVDSLQASIGNDKDSLTTEVAYRLNLTGPPVTIQSSSSTSLTAIHYACQSLLSYECDMALAGGVSIHLPEKSGYLYHEGGITSLDGHCRAYDSQAEGFVAGLGADVVTLNNSRVGSWSDEFRQGDLYVATGAGSDRINFSTLDVVGSTEIHTWVGMYTDDVQISNLKVGSNLLLDAKELDYFRNEGQLNASLRIVTVEKTVTINTISTGNVVQVTFDSAWTPGAYTWVLEYDAADEWSTSPTYDFLFTASTAFRVALPTAIPAYVFAP